MKIIKTNDGYFGVLLVELTFPMAIDHIWPSYLAASWVKMTCFCPCGLPPINQRIYIYREDPPFTSLFLGVSLGFPCSIVWKQGTPFHPVVIHHDFPGLEAGPWVRFPSHVWKNMKWKVQKPFKDIQRYHRVGCFPMSIHMIVSKVYPHVYPFVFCIVRYCQYNSIIPRNTLYH